MPASGLTLGRLERTNLREQARRALRTTIITGELKPGALYTIGACAEQLGVSATPVREALGDLAQVGLVEIVRNRGFIIPPLTERDLDEIFQIRLMLEPPALAEVAGTLSDRDLRACHELVEQGKAAAISRDLILFLEADREFHLRLIGSLGNQRLIKILGELRDQARLYGLPQLAAGGQLFTSALEHEALLKAIEEGDAEEARHQVIRHISHSRGAWAGRSEEPGQSRHARR